MSELRHWLENKQADLVESLEAAIVEQSEARTLTHAQVSAFVLAIAVATEMGNQVLDTLLEQWNLESEEEDEEQEGRWVKTMYVIRDELWSGVISEFSPVKALYHLKTLEDLLAHATARAAELDQRDKAFLLEQQLEKTQEHLRQLEQSKSDFINIAAHELKTPLTLIDGYANMLIIELPEETRARTDVLLGGISNGTRRLREIIEGMIDISMIDTQVLDISFQPISIRQILKMVNNELSTVLRIRQIELQVDDLPEDGAPSFGDSERLYQAFNNLVGNAIKYTPDNGRIHIKNALLPRKEDDKDGVRGYLHLEIVDTGIGIAPDDLERIFDKFVGLGSVALHSTGKYKFKGGGPGLGLTITRGIIEAHGGQVWAESDGYDEEECPGSTFRVVLPLLDEPPAKKSS